MRRMLYGVLDRVAHSAGAGPGVRRQADWGDGVIELIDASVPLTVVLRTLRGVLPAELKAVNKLAAKSVRLRLRLVLATGRVAVDQPEGFVGAALFEASRLLDAEVLRAALREREEDYALCVSDSVYSDTVRHGYGGVPVEEFREVTVQTKGGPQRAWLHQRPPALHY
ncbi:hypothetical protein EES41_39555 (plasmid) [Streptomyces sp. ADI95-16]|nr:hypothetical protein EES41_39555 [Streptomyces sp. ADI95-16]